MSERGVYFFFLLLLFPLQSFAKPICPIGEHWVASHVRRTYVRDDGNRVRAAQVKGHCRKNPRGYEKWHQNLSNNRPKIWGYKQEESKKWSVDEIERLHEALSVLPDVFLNLANVKIYRMHKSQFPGNPATSNNKDITLYDLAFQRKQSLAQIVAHELSHVLYRKLSEKEKSSFRQASGWIEHPEFKGALTTEKNKKFIQPDSRLSVDEDFSNHLEHFLFKNKSLKETSPKAYLWIWDKYGLGFKIKLGVKK